MNPFKSLLAILLVLCVFTAGLGSGYVLFRPAQVTKPTITSDLIVTSLRDRGFLISQTVLLDVPVTIDKNSGSIFRDFFLGQKIEARATMEANLGLDLSQLKDSDVRIDDSSITLTVPSTTLFNVRLVGPVEVKNAQGIVKRILDNDDGYNLALSALTKQAEAAATKPEYVSRARDAAHNELKRMLMFAAQGKRIEVKE